MSHILSLVKGKPIAYIEGGKLNGKTLKLYDIEDNSDSEDDEKVDYPMELLGPDFLKKNKIGKKNFDSFVKSLITGDNQLLDESFSGVYDKALKQIKEQKKKEFILSDGELFPIPPNTEEGFHIYIAAPTGAGKSTAIANWATLYKKVHPKNKLFIFSRDYEDEVINSVIGIKKIKLNDELLESHIDPIKFFKNSLVIFDDIDTIADKVIKEEVFRIRDDLLQMGRKHGISVACSSHLICNNQPTRVALNDSRGVIIYPHAGGGGLQYFLKKYIGLDTKQVAKILKLPSRWVYIKKDYPITIIYSKGAYLK